jgi:hypothetical protein
MCGCLGARHCGHGVSVVALAFQLARRERVLEREVLRFGTATLVLFLWVGRPTACGGKPLQRGPPGVNHVMMMIGIFG